MMCSLRYIVALEFFFLSPTQISHGDVFKFFPSVHGRYTCMQAHISDGYYSHRGDVFAEPGAGGSWPRCLLYRAAHTQRRIYHGDIIGENFTFRLPGGGQGSFSAPMFPPARRLCFHAPGEIQCIQVAREQQAASSPKSVSGASKMSFSKNKVSGLARSTGACRDGLGPHHAEHTPSSPI